MQKSTIGHIATAILFCDGPVQIDWGMISPKASTAVTDTTIAAQEGRTLSKKMGRHSVKPALKSRSVTSIQWYLSITGNILSACFLASSFPLASISRLSLSKLASPIVSPDINPAPKISRTINTEFNIIYPLLMSAVWAFVSTCWLIWVQMKLSCSLISQCISNDSPETGSFIRTSSVLDAD